MVTIEKLKNYLRIDDDLVEDDSMLQDLLQTSRSYIERSTGKTYVDGDHVYDMAIVQLAAHWYDNRQVTAANGGAAVEVPFSVKNLMIHIGNSRHYAAGEQS